MSFVRTTDPMLRLFVDGVTHYVVGYDGTHAVSWLRRCGGYGDARLAFEPVFPTCFLCALGRGPRVLL